jgi:polyferredoxin
MLFQGGFTFANFVADVFAVFMFVLWFWLFIVVVGDLFRRHDVSGLGKVGWVSCSLFCPISAFSHTSSRKAGQLRRMKRDPAARMICQFVGFSAADRSKNLID